MEGGVRGIKGGGVLNSRSFVLPGQREEKLDAADVRGVLHHGLQCVRSRRRQEQVALRVATNNDGDDDGDGDEE